MGSGIGGLLGGLSKDKGGFRVNASPRAAFLILETNLDYSINQTHVTEHAHMYKGDFLVLPIVIFSS